MVDSLLSSRLPIQGIRRVLKQQHILASSPGLEMRSDFPFLFSDCKLKGVGLHALEVSLEGLLLCDWCSVPTGQRMQTKVKGELHSLGCLWESKEPGQF